MKRFFLLVLSFLVLASCMNSSKESANLKENSGKSYDQNDGLITMRGEFVYYADAAVLQTKNDIYGVVIDENMHLLDAKVKEFKKEDTDMIPVTVRVRKFKKPETEEGWQFRVEIKEILKVEAPEENKDDVIKLAK